MTSKITPGLLAAMDRDSGLPPTKTTLDYLASHKAPSLAKESKAFRKRFKPELPGHKAKPKGKLTNVQLRACIKARQRTWKRYFGKPEWQGRYLTKWASEGFSLEVLEEITGRSEAAIKKMLRSEKYGN